MLNNLRNLLLLLLMLCPIASNAICDGTLAHPCIAQDIAVGSLPKHWRDAQMIATTCQQKNCATFGLIDLWMSGSAAPSTIQSWKAIRTAIENTTHNQTRHIIDFDLRQESHGYLNGQGITLAIKNDWINLGKSHSQVLQAEKTWLTDLAKQKTVNVMPYSQFKTHDFSSEKNVSVYSVTSEQNVVQANRFVYVRLTVPDHMPPPATEVDRFISIVRHLPPKTWLYFHCHGGDGRTTIFMSMFDMLHNANQLSFNQIIARQAVVPPYYDLAKIDRKHKEFTELYEKRLEFLQAFYRYAQDYLYGNQQTWSEWRKK